MSKIVSNVSLCGVHQLFFTGVSNYFYMNFFEISVIVNLIWYHRTPLLVRWSIYLTRLATAILRVNLFGRSPPFVNIMFFGLIENKFPAMVCLPFVGDITKPHYKSAGLSICHYQPLAVEALSMEESQRLNLFGRRPSFESIIYQHDNRS